MSDLKRYYRNIFRNGEKCLPETGYDRLPRLELESHLAVSRYGSFRLTEAVRPSFDLTVIPQEGYRHDHYLDPVSGRSVPVLMASVSLERLFDTFLALLTPLGDVVDAVLETSHTRSGFGHSDLYRERIDIPILKSYFYEYEEILMNDGCTGVAVLNPRLPAEVQFDEHKMLIVYTHHIQPFEQILLREGIRRNDTMRLITEAEHVHTTKKEYASLFQKMCCTLGIDNECWALY